MESLHKEFTISHPAFRSSLKKTMISAEESDTSASWDPSSISKIKEKLSNHIVDIFKTQMRRHVHYDIVSSTGVNSRREGWFTEEESAGLNRGTMDYLICRKLSVGFELMVATMPIIKSIESARPIWQAPPHCVSRDELAIQIIRRCCSCG